VRECEAEVLYYATAVTVRAPLWDIEREAGFVDMPTAAGLPRERSRVILLEWEVDEAFGSMPLCRKKYGSDNGRYKEQLWQ
jgi:hypothetical protein